MTAKEYLEQIQVFEYKIEQMEKELACLEETAGGASAIRYDKLHIQQSVVIDSLERAVIRVTEKKDKIFEAKCNLATLRAEIVEQIQEIDDIRYMRILYARYVEHKKFDEIAKEVRYDYDYVRVLHGEALGYFETRYLKPKDHTQSHIDGC